MQAVREVRATTAWGIVAGAILVACHAGPPHAAGPDDVDTWPFGCVLMASPPQLGDHTSSCETRASLVIARAGNAFTASRHEGVSGVMPACDSTPREDHLAGSFQGGELRLSGTAQTACGPHGPFSSPVTYVLRYDEDTDSFAGTRNGVALWCARLPSGDEPCAMPE